MSAKPVNGAFLAHLDCSTGVSGDKFLGALLDVGECSGRFTADDLRAAVATVAPEARVTVQRVLSGGIAAVSVSVDADGEPPHRHWRDVRALLEAAQLPEPVRDRALTVFAELAQAEALAHGVAVDDVHFHEVGAIDSIADVVGVCAGLEALEIEKLTVGSIATGWGTVDTSHGVLPVPAPATATLLVGLAIQPGPARPDGTAPGELTTPTGAALVRVLRADQGPCPPMIPWYAPGYGAGTRDIGHPNVCRLLVGDRDPGLAIDLSTEPVTVLETNVDHLSPEAAALTAEQLLAEGALDVWTAPVGMKKGRAGFVLCVLVPPPAAEKTAARIVALTGVLGVRRSEVERFVAERDIREVSTAYGTVRVKVGAGRMRPEADDVARIARETGRAFSAVERELVAIAEQVIDT